MRDSITSSVGPSLAVFGGKMYAVWKGDGGDEGIWWSHFDGSSWIPPIGCPAGFATSARPALTVWARGAEQKLVMAWKGQGMTELIHFAMFDGTAWGHVEQVPGPVITNDGPALAVFKGQLYFAWRGGGEDERICYCSYDGTTWSGPSSLPVPFAGSFGPALVVYHDQLYIAWKGREGDSKIWWTRTSDVPSALVPGTAPPAAAYAYPQNVPSPIAATTSDSHVAEPAPYGPGQPSVPEPSYGQAPVASPYGQAPPAAPSYGQTAPASGASPYGQPPATDPSYVQAPVTGPYGHAPTASPYGHSPPATNPYGQQPVITPQPGQPLPDSSYGQPPAPGPSYGQPPSSTWSGGSGTTAPPPGGNKTLTGQEHLEEIKQSLGSGAQYLFGKLKKK